MRAILLASSLALFAAACGPSSSGECSVCGDQSCVDTQSDPENCGGCGLVCPGTQVCVGGSCTADPGEACDPGAVEDCYSGADGTDGVAACHGGTRRCLDSGYWSSCSGEVTPTQDICGNNIDEDCDGTADNETDDDGDGYTNCGGDCCDSTNEGCTDPELVNPGAFEAPGNALDDDCDGQIDNVVAAQCDSGLMSNSANAIDYAKAMDICQESNGVNWGVVSARFLRADGTGSPVANQKAIRPEFGQTQVQGGDSMVVISTANAAAPGQQNPPFSSWSSTAHGTTSGFPADWFAANGNHLPNIDACPEPMGSSAHDPVMLELKIRTPTNAQSFSMRVNFMSAEYPEYTCSFYNDFFVVLLDSDWAGSPANPADKNLAFYAAPSGVNYPVGVNLAYGDTGLFRVCENGPTGCIGTSGNISTCVSTSELMGTGMEVTGGGCGSNDLMGGGTGWLTTSGNVVGGEEITLRIALWDTSDSNLDSVAMIDAFTWSIDPSDPGTVIDVD